MQYASACSAFSVSCAVAKQQNRFSCPQNINRESLRKNIVINAKGGKFAIEHNG